MGYGQNVFKVISNKLLRCLNKVWSKHTEKSLEIEVFFHTKLSELKSGNDHANPRAYVEYQDRIGTGDLQCHNVTCTPPATIDKLFQNTQNND